ncbi:hypothetical protein VTH82DRAFT_7772 [Thermothelomyces myriococcoides]
MPPPSIIRRSPPDAVIYDLSVPHQVTITLPAGSSWTSGLHWHETHTEYLRLVKGRIRLRLDDAVHSLSASSSSSSSSSSAAAAAAAASPTEIRVERGVWHEWGRASESENGRSGEGAETEVEGEDQEDVVVVERTEPADGDKAVFFWNLNGVILEAAEAAAEGRAQRRGLASRLTRVWAGLWTTQSLWAIFDALDNFPVFLGVRDAGRRWGLVRRGSRGDAWLTWWETRWSHALLSIASVLVWVVGERAVRPRFTPAEEYAAWEVRKQKAKNTRAPGPSLVG